MENKTIENTQNDTPDENKQLVETNKTLAVSEEFEDDDADFYYEVEEIVQMYITDTGVRMFEIKWKNYGREGEKKIEDTTNRKKQKPKESSRQQPGESSHPKGKDKSPILVEVHEKIEEEPDKKGKKKKKTKEERRRELLEESHDLQAMEETNRKRKAMAEDKKKKDLFDRQDEQAKKKKKKQDTFVVHAVKGEPGNKKRTDVHPKDTQDEDTTTKRRKLEEEAKNKNEEPKSNGPQTNGTTPTEKALPKRALTIIGSSEHKLPSESSSTKSLTSNHAKAAKPKLGISKDYKPSFTNLKRPISLSNPVSSNFTDIEKELDITEILRQSVGGKLPSIPKFTATQRLTNQAKSPSSPTQREPDPSDTVQKQSNFNATTFTSEPVTQPSSNTPSVSSPSSPSMSQRSSSPPSTTPRPADQNPRSRPNEPEALPMRRQTSRPDPRLIADNQRKLRIQNSTAFPTRFTANYVLKKGDKLISSVQIEGKQHCYHQLKIQKLIEISGDDAHTVKISSFLCLKRLDEFLVDRPFSFLHITAKDRLIELSKLKSFLQVNEMVGVVSHIDAPTHALVVLSEADAKKLKNLPKDIDLASSPYTQLCAIFIEHLPPKPNVEFNDLDLPDEEFTWLRVANYLKFDKRLIDLRKTSKFHVYGQSDAAQLLMRVVNGNKAYKKPATPDPSKPIYVMMFDRANQVAFSRNLLKHKREPSTQIWEFGAPDLSYPDMIPPSPIFPINTGGFVTTDIQNMIDNPSILEKISESISKFNSFPVVYGEWKLIIPHNFMYHFTRAIQDGESATRVQNSIVSITVGLSKGDIQVMRLWPAENENLDAVDYMDKILRYYYKSFQYFVMVDDVGSISEETKEKHRGLDFIKSDDLFSTFT
ncbi:uncharacterized protein B0P05DRAFT_533999 [Gilbertella persicaria]|uniref:uncharacterized protein n=1 Tax=Gilbertella persicaria TaxID=101096 RepID=UPI00221FD1F4|nr:uncharacterized protein B0P05DRAFT_533999 [Gilbertella persicaria]KAI8085860.1 hypothetical protein B0P05DRAFT_533999 [Gilbertella persicaria]